MMLAKEFLIVKKTLNKRALVFLAVMATFLLLSQLDKRYAFSDYIISETWVTAVLVLLFVLLLILAFWASTLKNHKVVGKLQFNPVELRIERDAVVEVIPVAEITSMEFEFNNIEGDPHVSGWLFGLFSGVTSSDGSGNYLKFTFNSVVYKLNLVIEQKEDYHAMRHLCKAILNQYGMLIEITGKRISHLPLK
jgi:fumarate reductase subunit C